MGKINVLSFAVANLIAAGEVVDRPASVIKELMENAIDAGADRITVEIQKGGIAFMRVSDNGCGIAAEDLPVALRRHATSKIKEASDLDAILSLGFRGEALAAISAVSHVRILSKPKDSAFGAMVESHGGVILGVTERGASDGTTVIVEDLFYNVPARRKFLKKDVTEAMAVTSTVERVALSHPEIAFTFLSDGVTRLTTPGDGRLQGTIYAVFGKEYASRLLAVESRSNDMRVYGYIGRSDNVKANRNYQNFFINGRYVKSKTATAAIEQAYSSYIPPEKFPCCVLFLEIHPGTVDVNVHPAKLEVKFSNEKQVFESVYYAVRDALEKNTTRPAASLPSDHVSAEDYRAMAEQAAKTAPKATALRQNPLTAFVPITDRTAPKPEQMRYDRLSARPSEAFSYEKAEPARPIPESRPQAASAPAARPAEPVSHDGGLPARPPETPGTAASPAAEAPVREIPSYRLVGEVFDSYLLVETDDKLLLIDKHAAHERLIFERFKKIMREREQASQLLMLPITVPLSREECQALEDYRAEIESAGFTFLTHDAAAEVQSLPTGIASEAVPDIMQTFADELLCGTGDVTLTRDLLFEKALYQASCKAAIKAGRRYAEGHSEWLCRHLMELPDITFCPHGRPVAIEMTKTMLDKQFERL